MCIGMKRAVSGGMPMKKWNMLDGLDREKAERDVEETFWEDFGGQECHLEHTTRGGTSIFSFRNDCRPSVSSSVDSDLDPTSSHRPRWTHTQRLPLVR
jgi:hypothetical protein